MDKSFNIFNRDVIKMRGKKILERFLICGMALLTLPLFCVSLKTKFADSDNALFIAAENSAELALLTLTPPETTAVTEAAIGENEDYYAENAASANSEANPPRKKALKITTDDSGMISQTELRVMPSSEDEEGYVPDPPEGGSGSDYSGETDNENGFDDLNGMVTEITYGEISGANYINLPAGGQLRNLTDMENTEIEAIIANADSLKLKADGTPEVLI
jgi:hypothetical protein